MPSRLPRPTGRAGAGIDRRVLRGFLGPTVLMALVLATGPPARAATYTVCPTGCNYSSLQAAVSAPATTGHTILVSAGTYRLDNELDFINKRATPAQPTVLKADGQVIIDCADAFRDSIWTPHSGDVYKARRALGLMNPPFTQVHVDDVRYKWVHDTAYTNVAAGTWKYDSSAALVYVNVGGGSPTAHDIYIGDKFRNYGIEVQRSDHLVIDGFTILRASDKGVYVHGDITQPRLKSIAVNRCVMKQSWGQGIYFHWTSGGSITNNTTSDNGSHGIHVARSDSGVVTGNESCRNDDPLAARGGKAGIKIGDAAVSSLGVTDVTIDCNVVHDNEDSGIDLLGATRVLVRRNVSYRNQDHGYDNNKTDFTAFINNLAVRNDHDGISVEMTSTNVAIFNCLLVHNGLVATSLAGGGGMVGELFVDNTTGFLSNNNVIVGLAPGAIPGGTRYLVHLPGVSYGSLAAYQAATGQDAQSYGTVPAFADTTGAVVDFSITSGADNAVDAARTDLPGWLAPMWLAKDALGYVPHNAAKTDAGSGSVTYADIGVYEFDPPPGIPKLGVATGRWDFLVLWTERGDDGDQVGAGTRELYLNGAPYASFAALPPGTPVCFDVNVWPDCTPFQLQLKITEADNGKVEWSNTISARTDCSGNRSHACEKDGPGEGNRDGASPTFGAAEADGEQLEDFALSLGAVGPNPARSLDGVVYAIPHAMSGQPYELALFDVSGRRVALFGSGSAVAGRRFEPMPGSSGEPRRLAAGVYFLRLAVGDRRLSRTLILVP